jgi:hypothetical protein
MKSQAKSLVRDGCKRKYAKTILRVYGTVGEITSANLAGMKGDGGMGNAMTRSGT